MAGLYHAAVETLPDRDQRQWEPGHDGEPEDPWQIHWNVVLQNVATPSCSRSNLLTPPGAAVVGCCDTTSTFA